MLKLFELEGFGYLGFELSGSNCIKIVPRNNRSLSWVESAGVRVTEVIPHLQKISCCSLINANPFLQEA